MEQTPEAEPVLASNVEVGEDNKPITDSQPKLTKNMLKIMEMDEHKLDINGICDRFGYRSEYFLTVGVTLGHVEYAQKQLGKNEITSYFQ